jgi:hypothetical protein
LSEESGLDDRLIHSSRQNQVLTDGAPADIDSTMEFQRLEIERLKSEIELAQLQLDLERLLNTQSKSPSASLQKTDSKLKTPRMEPEVFCGDRMKYPLWWRSFEALIERATACESDSCVLP